MAFNYPKTRLFYLSLLFFLLAASPQGLRAQGYIGASTFVGGLGTQDHVATRVVNGETYLLGTTDTGVTTTNGSAWQGARDIYLTKLDADGNVLFSILLGGSDQDVPVDLEVSGSAVYVAGHTNSPNFPTTNATVYGGNRDGIVAKLDANTGATLFSTYIGGASNDYVRDLALSAGGTVINIVGVVESAGLPVSNSSSLQGFNDIYYLRMDANGNTLFSSYLGGSGGEWDDSKVVAEGSDVYIAYATYSDDVVTTDGTAILNTNMKQVVAKFDASANLVYQTLVGEISDDYCAQIQVEGGEVYLGGNTFWSSYPTTDGSFYHGGPNDIFVTKLSASGAVAYSTLIGGSDSEPLLQDKNYNVFQVQNGRVYLLVGDGSGISLDYPVTNGTNGGNTGGVVLTHLDPSGAISFSTHIADPLLASRMGTAGLDISASGDMYVLAYASDLTTLTTDGSQGAGQLVPFFLHFKSNGELCYATLLEGVNSSTEAIPLGGFYVENGAAYFGGYAQSLGYPVTTTVTQSGRDIFWTRLVLDASISISGDSPSPLTQNACAYGLSAILDGDKLEIAPSSLPTLYRNGVPVLQRAIEGKYQWQTAASATGPWSDIPGAVLEDYLPSLGAVDVYYRRLAFSSACSSTPFSTSDVSSVLMNGLTAPTVDGGGVFHTCPGTAVTIGGAPTASGGTGSYTYSWDNGGGASANPTVTPIASTIYTVYVTDNGNGCQQIDQALVNAWEADAGADRNNCAGTPVRLLGEAIAGVPGVVYAWTPTTGLSDPSIAQPMANPAGVTNYTFSLTVPVTGGGTCTRTDVARVTPVAAPSANFAGPDVTFCYPGTANLGTVAQPGYTYTWAPGNNLSVNNASQTVYSPGLTFYPNPDSAVYYVTAIQGECSFVDAVTVNIIDANAGIDGCGPRYIGGLSDVPALAESFSWTRISGTGNFTGATNIPITSVSATPSGSTTYQLTTTYKGVSCTDEVVVPPCGCNLTINVSGEYGCPNAGLGSVSLTAIPAVGLGGDYSYSWTPAVGLSSYNTQTVNLTDNVARTYTVTITSLLDGSFSCSANIDVNQAPMTIPVFVAQDHSSCPGTVVNLGQATVAGYDYLWTPATGLSSATVSNPSLTVTQTRDYIVKVTDVGTGCFTRDTASVVVSSPVAKAGPDWTVCDNAVIQLGAEAPRPHHLYAWTPGTAPWQDGTDSTFAQPEVLIATNLQFILVATDTITGCIARDTVLVTVDNTPTLPAAPDVTICRGSSDTLGLPALGGVTYSWSPSTGLSCTTCAQPIASPTSTTTYTVSATFPGCGSTVDDVIITTVNGPSSNMADISYCPSSGAVALGADAPAGMTSYSWSPASQVTSPNTQLTNTLTPAPSAETDYVLTLTDASGCSAKDTVTITPNVTTPIAGNNGSMCLGTTRVLGSASNTTGGGITYSWSPATGLSNPASHMPTFNPPAAGSYTFTLSRTEAGCTSTASVTINVIDFSVPAISSPTVCQGSCVEIGTSPVFGVQYFWSPIMGLSDANIANPVACVSATTTYTLTAVSGQGCVATQNVVVGVSPTPAPSIVLADVDVCLGTPTVTLSPIVSPAGSYSYLWSPNDGTLNDIYSANPVANIIGTGTSTYEVIVTNTSNNCSSSADVNVNVDFCPVVNSLGDFVWLDTDQDGVQDAGEPGVAGVSVNLYTNGTDGIAGNADDILVGATVTDAYGMYLFENLPDGNYNVGFVLPVDYSFTSTTGSSDTDATNSDPNGLTGRTGTINLAGGETELDVDAGIIFTQPVGVSSIGDYVWYDDDADGIQDPTESGVAGVTVTLYDAVSGNVLAITTTDASGHYIFNNLPNGDYQVGFTPAAGTLLTSSTGTTPGNATTNSDANASTGLTSTISITTAGTVITGIDAGLIDDAKASLGDYVWNDLDQDGVQDANEPGIGGVVLTLYSSTDSIIGNGDDVLVTTTMTDPTGAYWFGNLDPAYYFVTATLPSGYTITGLNQGGNVLNDNDFSNNPAFAGVMTSGLYNLLAGQNYPGVDMGVYNNTATLGSIGDYVWLDLDGDGVQDVTETGVSNVTVSLLDGSGNPVNNPATGEPYVVVTDANGFYQFVDLPAGDYQVNFSNLPPNTVFSPTTGGTPSTNSDANPVTGTTSTITLASGQDITDVDAGIVPSTPSGLGSLGNKVWIDADNDGVQDASEQGVAGVTVNLYFDANGDGMITGTEATIPFATTQTDGQGNYLFTGLTAGAYQVGFATNTFPAGYALQTGKQNAGGNDELDSDANPATGRTAIYTLAQGEDNLTVDAGIYSPLGTNSIGDYVWLDTDMDGLQDGSEMGVSGVVVNLLDATGKILSTVLTDENGNYFFGNLPNGNYSVQVVAPVGFDYTGQNVPSSTAANGSDVDETTGKTASVSLTGGTNITTLDAGLTTSRAGLGNYVWMDSDMDGVQDAGESGVAGVTVNLYFDADNNGTISGAEATTPVASTITDANGAYYFANLLPGNYQVGFSTLPSGVTFTQQNTPGDNQNNTNSDANPATGLSSIVNLAAGEFDNTIDAGLTPTLLGSVGDVVWFDADSDGIRDAGEALVPGVLVTLLDNLGNVVGTAITDGKGSFLFENVPAGTYSIVFSNLPSGASFTTQTVGTLDGSDANATGTTPSFTVVGGQKTPHIDAGITPYNPLPIALLSFTAEKQGEQAALSWITSSEQNASHFEVERNLNGTWSKIAMVQATGNSVSPRTYGALDRNPINGENTYRLKLVDVDGQYAYSNVRTLFFDATNGVSIYPNPADGFTNVAIDNLDGVEAIRLYNNLGQIQAVQIVNNAGLFNVETKNLAEGVYFIAIERNKQVSTYKFVVGH